MTELATYGDTIAKQSATVTERLKKQFYRYTYEFVAEGQDNKVMRGTGFRTGNWFLTNAHVVAYLLRKGNILDLDYRLYVENLETRKEFTVQLKLLSRVLDAAGAIYTKKNYPEDSGLQITTPSRGDEVFIMGKPISLEGKAVVGGQIKSVDLESEGDYAKYSFAYNMDTDQGSSGSPLLNKEGQVVGMHWGAAKDKNISYGVPGDRLKKWLKNSPTGGIDDGELNNLQSMINEYGLPLGITVGGMFLLSQL